MIESVTVTNSRNNSIILKLADPFENGILIQGIDGIGPGKADINTTELATTDGGIINSARLSSRNIVFNLLLLEAPDVETTRHRVYKCFPIKKEVGLTIKTDQRTVSISGIVESNEPDIFSEQESMQVSIICPDPYFYAENALYKLNGVTQAFSFPFSNESLNNKVINLGEITYTKGEKIYYDGEIDSGVIIKIHATDHVEDIWIRNDADNTTMALDTSKIDTIVGDGNNDIIAEDVIYISTMKSKRYVHLVRNGVTYNILQTLPKGSKWIMLQSGVNSFSYGASDGIMNAEIDIASYVLYSGI